MDVLSNALRQTLKSTRLTGLIYGIILVAGLLAALPFYDTLQTESYDSMAFLTLLNGFDYTIYSDFMQQSRKALSPLFIVGQLLGVLYILLSIFFAGGILLRFAQPTRSFDAGSFWQGCTYYAGRFLRLFGVTFLCLLAETVIWLVMGTLVGVAFSDSLTERGFFWIGMGFFTLFVLTSTCLLCIGDYAKVLMVREDERNAFQAFKRAGRMVFRALPRTYGYYWLLIAIGTALFGVYFLLDELIPMSNWGTILLMFVVQQTLIFARIGLKVWSLGIAWAMYEVLSKPLPVLVPASVVSPVSEFGDESPLSIV